MTMFAVIKVYHRPSWFVKGEDNTRTPISNGNERLQYTYRNGRTATEFNVRYVIEEPQFTNIEITAVAYTWPSVGPIPEELLNRIAKYIATSFPGDSVTTRLVRITEEAITTMAEIVQEFDLWALDNIDPRTEPDKAMEHLYRIEFNYYGFSIDLTRYYYIKKTGMFPEVTDKYRPLEKYMELLMDDFTTRALERFAAKSFDVDGVPDPDWWGPEDVEWWITL